MRKELLSIGRLTSDLNEQLNDAERGVDILCELLGHVTNNTCHPYLEEIAKIRSSMLEGNVPSSECWKEYMRLRIDKEKRKRMEAEKIAAMTEINTKATVKALDRC